MKAETKTTDQSGRGVRTCKESAASAIASITSPQGYTVEISAWNEERSGATRFHIHTRNPNGTTRTVLELTEPAAEPAVNGI